MKIKEEAISRPTHQQSEFNFYQKIKGAELNKPTISPKRYVTERIRLVDRTEEDSKQEAKQPNPERKEDESFSFTHDRTQAAHDQSTPPQRQPNKDVWNDSFGSFGTRMSGRVPKPSPPKIEDKTEPPHFPLVVNQASSFNSNNPTPLFNMPPSNV